MTHNLDLERAGVPSLDLGVCRNEDYESETFDFHHLDLSSSTLEFYISEQRDTASRLATFVVSKETETKTYQAYIDECRFETDWIPCGETEDDLMTSSVVNISAAKSTFANLPRAIEQGEPVTLYYVLRQTAPTEDVLLAGRFYLTETA